MRGWASGAEGRLALLQACLGGSGFAAETLAEVLVIKTLGPPWLPFGLAGAAVLSLGLTAGLARRQAGPRRLVGLAGAVVAAGVIIWGGLLWVPAAAALLFLLVSRPLRDALGVAAGNLIAARYDPQAAKRAFPRLAAAGQTGAILVGLLLPLLLAAGGPPVAIIAWPALAGAALLVAWGLPLVLAGGVPARAVARPATLAEAARTGLQRSPLLWSLAAAATCAVATGAALGLVAAMDLSAAIPDSSRLASLYALTGAFCSLGVLAVQAVGLPWLIRRLGTARAALLPPALALGVGTWALVGSGLGAGLAAQAGRLTIRPALQTPLEEILLGLLPTGERAAGRAWLRGAAVPLAGMVSSLALAGLAALGAGPKIVAGLAVLTATGGLAAALVLRRQHRQAALALARGGDVLAQRLMLPTFGGVGAAVREEIARRMETSERDDERRLLVALLANLDRPAATAAVAGLLPDASPSLTVALLTALAEHGCPAAPLLPEAPRLLASSTPAVRRAALAVLATAPALAEALVAPLLDNPDPEVALLASECLLRRGGPQAGRARERLLLLAQDGPAAVRAAAAPLLAPSAPAALVALLGDPAAAVRRSAALAAGTLAPPPAAVMAALVAAATDGTSAVRVAAVGALARCDGAETTLRAALDDPVAGVRAAATQALLEGGRRHTDALAQHVLPGHGWRRATELAILTRRAPWRWRSALVAEESAGLAAVAQLTAARASLGPPHGPAGTLLRRDVDDAIAEGLARWGEGLVATDGTGAERVIRQGLAAADPLVRAHAQEALEAVRSPALARLAAGLLAPGDAAARAALDGQGQAPNGVTSAANETLATDAGCWRRTLLAAAAREEPGFPGEKIVTDRSDGKDGTMLSLVERATLLQGVPPFADLSSEQLRLLAGVAEEIDIAAGETLIAAGTAGDHLYVVVTGQIALEERRGAGGSVARIGTLGSGAALGEDAVFDGGAHVLNAAAISDCHLLSLGREVLLTLLEEQPALARALIAWLSGRLRETSGKLAERTRPRPRSVIDLLDQLGEGRR